MQIEAYYKSLLDNNFDALSNLLSDVASNKAFSKTHNYTLDYDLIYRFVSARPEGEMLHLAIREYQSALYAVAIGNYRHANVSLRLFIEIALAAIQFSANELKLRRWLKGSTDIVWSGLIDSESGVYAKGFIGAFTPELEDLGRQYGKITEQLYRECSEYVHGNLHTHQKSSSPAQLDRELLLSWIDRSETARLIVVFAFASRYLGLMQKDDKTQMESVLLDVLGHVPAVRAFYEK